jgi:hypothetical protein
MQVILARRGMGFSNTGCLKITVDSGLGIYQFIFSGSDKLIWNWRMENEWPEVYHFEQMIRNDLMMRYDWEPDL